jgi:hypothetical protein
VLNGVAYQTSAEMAKYLGPFARFEENKKHMMRVMRNHRYAAYNASDAYEGLSVKPVGIDPKYCPDYLLTAATSAWDKAVQMGEEYGYRNAQATVIAPTGTIGLVMDCDTTGIEPDFALVKFKKLSGGGYFKIINSSVPSALKNLGYSESERDAIIKYAEQRVDSEIGESGDEGLSGRNSLEDVPINIANALLEHLSGKLPISRLQRDLTDSTVLRNLGVPFGHIMIALNSLERGLGKLILNTEALDNDLENNWAVVAEAIQTVLRRERYPNPYEALKELTRGNHKITKSTIHNFIDTLEISTELKNELKQISPQSYTGVSSEFSSTVPKLWEEKFRGTWSSAPIEITRGVTSLAVASAPSTRRVCQRTLRFSWPQRTRLSIASMSSQANGRATFKLGKYWRSGLSPSRRVRPFLLHHHGQRAEDGVVGGRGLRAGFSRARDWCVERQRGGQAQCVSWPC